MTQEAVAEALGISHQTASSWKNKRPYPVVSVIKPSYLYSVSLDKLPKRDRRLMQPETGYRICK